jgi:hypothetical protein
MTDATAIKEAAAVNEEMVNALLVIHRIASRALSDEERIGQRIQRNPRGEINGLLVQIMAIEKLARSGLPKHGRELLDLAAAKEETASIRAEGRKQRSRRKTAPRRRWPRAGLFQNPSGPPCPQKKSRVG